MTRDAAGAPLARFAEIDWVVPPNARERDRRPPAEGSQPLLRKQLHEDAFHAHAVRLAPGFEVPPHRHDIDELMWVISGSCRIGDLTLRERDSIVLRAHQEYGFTAGDDGMEFLIVRMGKARILGIPGVDESR